jgi:hypothetical protein
MVQDHGEMGPVLTWKKHNSLKLADLGSPTVAGEVLDSVVDQTPYTTLMKELKAEELEALRTYTGNGYEDMNQYLRDLAKGLRTGESSTTTAQKVRTLTEAFDGARLSADITLYRGTGLSPFKIDRLLRDGDAIEEKLNKLLNQNIVEDGFTSASVSEGSAFSKRITRIIDAPEGLPALDVNGISDIAPYQIGISGEQEITLRPGQRYKVLEVTRTGDALFTVRVRALKEGEQ